MLPSAGECGPRSNAPALCSICLRIVAVKARALENREEGGEENEDSVRAQKKRGCTRRAEEERVGVGMSCNDLLFP